MKINSNLKVKKGFIDYFIENTNKDFGNFILRTWYNVKSPMKAQYHQELVKDNGLNTGICKNDYYKKHNIDQLKNNNLASKMIYSQLFIEKELTKT